MQGGRTNLQVGFIFHNGRYAAILSPSFASQPSLAANLTPKNEVFIDVKTAHHCREFH
jgi:hypothetical protein